MWCPVVVSVLALRLGAFLRGRAVAVIAAGLAVAVISAAVLAVAAGARRTATAPDRFTDAAGGNPDAELYQQEGRPRTAEVAGLAAVGSVEAITFVAVGLTSPDGSVFFDSNPFAGSIGPAARLVAGRRASPDDPGELVANRAFIALTGLGVGARLPGRAFSQEQTTRNAFAEEPAGAVLEATIVGIAESPDDLDDPTPMVTFSPALLDLPDVGAVATISYVRLAPGASLADLRAQLDALPPGPAIFMQPAVLVSPSVRLAVSTQASALWLVAVVLALAAVVGLGQLLGRLARLDAGDRWALAALGMGRRAQLGEEVVRAGVPLAVGVLAGAGIAVAASDRFPLGFAQGIEPAPGIRVEAVTLAVAAAALVTGVLVWVVVAARLAGRASKGERPSAVAELAAARISSTAATGVRFALLPRRADGSGTATIAGLALLVAGVAAALVFAASAGRLVGEGARFGANADAYFGNPFIAAVTDVVAPLAADPDVDGLVAFGAGSLRVGEEEVAALGVDLVRGGLAPPVLDGRLPAALDEVALGRSTARTLGVGVGDRLAVEGPSGAAELQVVGLVVVPNVGFGDGLGSGAVLEFDALRALDASVTRNLVGITLRPGADAGTLDRLSAEAFSPPAVASLPADIRNLDRVGIAPWVLAGLLALIGAVTLLQALLGSVRGRRRDLAVLRTLGAGSGWVSRAVHWQATTLGLVPLLIGVPVGVVAGRMVFRTLADRIGAVPDPAPAGWAMVALAVGVLALANLTALWPSVRARRVHPARLLREE
jgi:hypothetical protein